MDGERERGKGRGERLRSDASILKCAKIHCLHVLLLFIEFVCDGPPKKTSTISVVVVAEERNSEFCACVSRVNFLFFSAAFFLLLIVSICSI